MGATVAAGPSAVAPPRGWLCRMDQLVARSPGQVRRCWQPIRSPAAPRRAGGLQTATSREHQEPPSRRQPRHRTHWRWKNCSLPAEVMIERSFPARLQANSRKSSHPVHPLLQSAESPLARWPQQGSRQHRSTIPQSLQPQRQAPGRLPPAPVRPHRRWLSHTPQQGEAFGSEAERRGGSWANSTLVASRPRENPQGAAPSQRQSPPWPTRFPQPASIDLALSRRSQASLPRAAWWNASAMAGCDDSRPEKLGFLGRRLSGKRSSMAFSTDSSESQLAASR